MSRESAVTEQVSYRVEECHHCGTGVGLDTEVAHDELTTPGYAVVVGDGVLTVSEEQQGNWSHELDFAGEKGDSAHPNVKGFIICEECAESVHGHGTANEKFFGEIPQTLQPSNAEITLPLSKKTLAAVAITVVLLLLLLI